MRGDGGPAFPGISFEKIGDYERGSTDGGMSLRDYFAAVEQSTYVGAASGPLGRLWERLWWGPTISDEQKARECYEAADAMLAARTLTPSTTEDDDG